MGLPFPKPPLEVEKHLENGCWSQDFGIWRHREPLVWGLSQAALFHVLCLKPEFSAAQLFKSEPFKSIVIITQARV